jgi:hypothetical protein
MINCQSSFAFNFNLRQYTEANQTKLPEAEEPEKETEEKAADDLTSRLAALRTRG